MAAVEAQAPRDAEKMLQRIHELEDLQQRVEEQAANMVAVAEDLELARRAAEAASRNEQRSAALTKAILDTVPDGIVTIDENGRIESGNRGLEATFGYRADALHGTALTAIVPSFELARFRALNYAASLEMEVRRHDGTCVPAEIFVGEMRADADHTYTCVIRDISQRKHADATIRKLALQDTVTGLANRNMFSLRLETALAMADRSGRPVALALLDLDKFKDVNDTYGHPVGDALLAAVATVLRAVTREVDTVARLGGDEFAIIFVDLNSRDIVGNMLARVVETLSKPLLVEDTLVGIGVSAGVSFYPNDDTDVEELLKKADRALYEAKSAGRNCYRFYDDAMFTAMRARKTVETDMKLGLVRDEFMLHYQPQICSESGRCVGLEALVRWQHAGRGLVRPDDFIPIAEATGLIVDLGTWVLRNACVETKALQAAGLAHMRTAVNISARQLQSDDFISSVEQALKDSRLDPSCLEIEITESMVMEDLDSVVEKLQALNDMDVAVTIDDFGTGYSSLMHLKRFPIQKLKIDRSFVQNVTTDRDDAAISQAVINLGHGLGLRVIAEGVETPAQITHLKDRDCDELQSFYFGRPMPADQLSLWYLKRRAEPLAAHHA